MYATIRQYYAVDPSVMPDVTRRAMAGLRPILSSRPGFVSYQIVCGDDGALASMSVFETKEAAEQSNRIAAEWVQENIAELLPNRPAITIGELVGS